MRPPKSGARHSFNEKSSQPKHKPLTRTLGVVQHCFLERCRRLLERALLETEERLHELTLTDRAQLSLDVMQGVRSESRKILRVFVESLDREFCKLTQPGIHPTNFPGARANLAVVDGETFELEHALREYALKTRVVHAGQLDAAHRRLDYLLLQVSITNDNSPIDPVQVTKSFLKAVSNQADLPQKAMVILFMQFQSHVLGKLGGCFSEVNNVLIDAGILLDIGSKRDAPCRPDRLLSTQSLKVRVSFPETSETSGANSTCHGKPVDDACNDLNAVVPAISRYDNVTGQHSQQQWLLSDESDAFAANTLSRDEIIERCSALFEEIQTDHQIPYAIKAVIGRLVMPYTRFAILRNSSFLVQAGHPARSLLSLLFELGRSRKRVRPVELDPVYQNMVSVVSSIKSNQSLTDADFFRAFCDLSDDWFIS